MRKVFLAAVVCLLLPFLCPSEETSFTLIPVEFFAGDEVRALYSFISNDAFLVSLTEKSSYSFSAENLFTSAGFDCDCTGVQVSRNTSTTQTNSYTITITFFPFKPGKIDLPPFDLAQLIVMSVQSEKKLTSYSSIHIDLPPFDVLPILSRYPSDSLRPPKGPVIIPGTTYVLYGLAALLVVIIGLALYAGLKFEKIRTKISSLYHNLFISVNLRQSFRSLRRLQKKESDMSPSEFAQAITTIIRSFLERRFYLPFSCACTDELQLLFNERFKDVYTEEQHDAVHRLYELFLRCDFIRFSCVQKDTHTLSTDERKRLLQKANDLLLFFEKGESGYA